MVMRLSIAWLVVASVAGCVEVDDTGPASLILGDRMVYTLEWDRSGTTPLEAGAGWRTVNDLGFEFEVSQGFLVTNRMELLPCNWGADDDAGPTDVAWKLLDWLTGGRAVAVHPEDAPNSTRVLNFAEPIHSPMTVAYSTHETQAVAYCRFSYAAARADVATTDRPESLSISGQSLRLIGRWRGSSESTWQSFDWETSLPWGAFWDFAYSASAADDEQPLVHVIVKRPLARIFMGLDPDSQRPEVLGNKAVQNLVMGVRVELRKAAELWHTHDPI